MRIAIKNGTLIDGIGTAGVKRDLVVVDDKIDELGEFPLIDADLTINASGKIVCPGFIDPHTHCKNGDNVAFARQGVTSVVDGNCGFAIPMADRKTTFADNRKLTNFANLVGLNNARINAMGGSLDRSPTLDEIRVMKRYVEENMEAGALGVSTGLAYPPGCYSTAEEVIEVVKAAVPYGGYYTSHMRNGIDYLSKSVDETIRVGRECGLPAHISHFKVYGVMNYLSAPTLLEQIDAARSAGVKTTIDQYPYVANNGSLRLLFPAWALAGGEADIRNRLDDGASRGQIKSSVVDWLQSYLGGCPELAVVSLCAQEPELVGLNLREIGERMGMDSDIDGVAESVLSLLRRYPSHMGCFLTCQTTNENDVETIMSHPATAICSDAWAVPFGENRPHPRHYGPFPRVLGRYCREKKLFSLAEAVRKMTLLTADILGLKKRGALKRGHFADIVVFDPTTVIDNATFENPHQYPTGIDAVIVNGEPTVLDGALTGREGGRFLLR